MLSVHENEIYTYIDGESIVMCQVLACLYLYGLVLHECESDIDGGSQVMCQVLACLYTCMVLC